MKPAASKYKFKELRTKGKNLGAGYSQLLNMLDSKEAIKVLENPRMSNDYGSLNTSWTRPQVKLEDQSILNDIEALGTETPGNKHKRGSQGSLPSIRGAL